MPRILRRPLNTSAPMEALSAVSRYDNTRFLRSTEIRSVLDPSVRPYPLTFKPRVWNQKTIRTTIVSLKSDGSLNVGRTLRTCEYREVFWDPAVGESTRRIASAVVAIWLHHLELTVKLSISRLPSWLPLSFVSHHAHAQYLPHPGWQHRQSLPFPSPVHSLR